MLFLIKGIYEMSKICYNNLTKQDEIRDFCVSENILSCHFATAKAVLHYCGKNPLDFYIYGIITVRGVLLCGLCMRLLQLFLPV